MPDRTSPLISRTSILAGLASIVALTAIWTLAAGLAEPDDRSAPGLAAAEAAARPTPDAEPVSEPPPGGDAGPSPTLERLAARQTFARDEPHTITFTGTLFDAGQTVRLISPDGLYISTYGARALRVRSPESFEFSPVFDQPGVYRLSVRSAAGRRSNEIPITVK